MSKTTEFLTHCQRQLKAGEEGLSLEEQRRLFYLALGVSPPRPRDGSEAPDNRTLYDRHCEAGQ